MNILIVGYGYVGKAVASIFKKTQLTIIDPKFNNLQIKDFAKNKFDVVFVCVDTPVNEKFKTLDSSLKKLNRHLKKNTIVCCKSTALPTFYLKAVKRYKNIKLIYSPEYLSHHSNIKDFQAQTFCILGGEQNACIKLKSIFLNRLANLKNVFITNIDTAAFIKYAANSFFAFKITFFNELFEMHKKLKIRSSFNEMRDLLIKNHSIGESHTQVPGRDGKRGWGGHCLSKDIMELFEITKSNMLKDLIDINKKHRKININ